MRHKLHLVLLGVLAAWSGTARAQATDDVMGLVRADRWAEAQAAASAYLDPVVGKLVTYYRLLAPNAAGMEEIAAFQAANPDWPLQFLLNRRREEAEAATADDDPALPAACARSTPSLPLAMLRCAEVLTKAGRGAEAAAMGQAAFVAGDDGIVARMLPRWAPVIDRAAQWRRFDRLAWNDPAAAARQIPRLDTTDRPKAEVRLALRRDLPNAESLLGALPASQQVEPGIMLEHARWLRRANRDDDAMALWLAAGTAAERAAPPERVSAFWDERNLLARRRLRQGDAAGAYRIVSGHAQVGAEQIADAEFLAGWIALRKLNDPAGATAHFRRLADVSKAAITQGRAHYWLGRAGGGAAEYAQAAAWPNTFYGQLAVLALRQDLGAAIRAARTPQADSERALELAGREVARAAAYLVGWGEPRRAQAFLLRLDDIAPDAQDRALVARLAQGFGQPETAVALARRAGRDGLIQIETGWPVAATIPSDLGLDPALALGIIRQESSFDSATVSPAGARGLMQLMPATATLVGRQIGTPVQLPALTGNPALNVRLGATYLKALLDQFGGVVPFAVAGYNAGPGHIAEWNAAAGDPRDEGGDMIDWIELIPFGETRNYVQRVIENQVIYTALTHGTAPHPLAAWLK
ncbi:MAG TPA: lytic transglycosylase domain-containing protein [Rhizomicrobium sp.]